MDESNRDQQMRGRTLAVLAAVLWSTSGFFAKAPFLEAWTPDQRGLVLAFWRTLFASLALLPFIGRPVWTWRLAPAMICFALMNIAFLLAMTNTTAANAIWLQYTAPAFVFLGGVVFLKERIVRGDITMVVLGMVGVAIILACQWTWGEKSGTDRVGTLWGLASGVTLAGVMLSLRNLRDLSGFWVTFCCQVSATLLLAPWVISQHGLQIGWSTAAWMAAFGILQFGVPYLLFARALRYITGHEASCLTLLEPLLVPAWVYLMWRDADGYRSPAWWTWCGAVFILAGLVVRYWPQKESQARR
jgi:drug/metabolite transporter (DMT)-like permease